MTTFVRSAILSADYIRLNYISSDGHFSVVYLYCLATALTSLLNVLCCRVNAIYWAEDQHAPFTPGPGHLDRYVIVENFKHETLT